MDHFGSVRFLLAKLLMPRFAPAALSWEVSLEGLGILSEDTWKTSIAMEGSCKALHGSLKDLQSTQLLESPIRLLGDPEDR